MSEQLILEIIPEFVKIKIGNSTFDLAFDSLIASMTHQYLSNHHTMREDSDYDLIFEVTKELISDFTFSRSTFGFLSTSFSMLTSLFLASISRATRS